MQRNRELLEDVEKNKKRSPNKENAAEKQAAKKPKSGKEEKKEKTEKNAKPTEEGKKSGVTANYCILFTSYFRSRKGEAEDR